MGFQINKLSKYSFLIVAVSMLLISCFFTIPYLLPPKELAVSISYDHGFNNKIGVLLVWGSVVVFSYLGYRKQTQSFSFFSSFGVNEEIPFYHLVLSWMILVLYIMICGVFCGRDLAAGWGECTYFIPHVYDMIYGCRPYEDFAFYYGPLMIYTPFWMFSIFPISVECAYLITLFLFHGIGLYMLFDIVNKLNTKDKYRKWIFWVSFCLTFPVALGLNYQLLRFILPFWCLYKLYSKNKMAYVLAPLFVILTLSISPEYGLVFFVILTIFYTFRFCIYREKYYVVILLTSAIVPLLFMYNFRHMFSYLLSFSSGLFNFPFVPSFHLFVFFVFVMILAYLIGGIIHNYRNSDFNLFFILLSFGLIPAALGRCDPAHVTYNGFFIFLAACAFLLYKFEKIKLVLLCINILLVLMIQGWLLRAYYDLFMLSKAYNCEILNKSNCMLADLQSCLRWDTKHVDKNKDSINSQIQAIIDCRTFVSSLELYKRKIILPVINSSNMIRSYIYLTERGECTHLYINRISLSGDVDNVESTVNELKQHKTDLLLVEDGWDSLVNPSDFKALSIYLFYSYYPFKSYRNSNIVFKPLIDYIHDNYEIIKKNGKFQVLKMKS